MTRHSERPTPKAGCVVLRLNTGEPIELSFNTKTKLEELQHRAMHWTAVVRNRTRWSRSDPRHEQLVDRAAMHLDGLGLKEKLRKRLAKANLIEVAMLYRDEAHDWEKRIFPWEYVLSACASKYGGQSPTIVRNLTRSDGPNARQPLRRVLFVTACPGSLADEFAFDNEQILVKTNLPSAEHVEFTSLECPSATKLRAWIRTHSPDVIHITGVDAHQGAELLGKRRDPRRRDGIYLNGRGGPAVVDAEQLGGILNAGRDGCPHLVFINTFNSAGRLAAMAVAHGAGAAIGFQDVFDDAAAEMFLAEFYRVWTELDRDEHRAFELAWRSLRPLKHTLRGSGVVLWSDTSRPPSAAKRTAPPIGPYELRSDEVLRDILEVEIKLPAGDDSGRLPSRLNYCMLHNNSNLFESFRLFKRVQGVIRDVEVFVDLQVGAEHFPFRATIDVDRDPKVLESEIRVPLTWSYVRSLKESVLTNLFVEVKRGDQVAYRNSLAVVLRPIDEWEDTDDDRVWLPSFILPRQDAVAAVVAQAQRYLCALVDDTGAGFDGYQSVEQTAEDPGAPVDLQVRALWSALIYEYQLGYINPPPSYSYTTQRLRTPDGILARGHGTCIDLTLLLAACLEYVEIYPAIFLFTGHAFPAYWRTAEAYENFRTLAGAFSNDDATSNDKPMEALGRSDSASSPRPWMVAGLQSHMALLESVRRGDLVPLESVALTQQLGYFEGVAQGVENLSADTQSLEEILEGSDPDAELEFNYLIDVPLARMEYHVTPLPLAGD